MRFTAASNPLIRASIREAATFASFSCSLVHCSKLHSAWRLTRFGREGHEHQSGQSLDSEWIKNGGEA